MTEFKVGDRVVVARAAWPTYNGITGVIVRFSGPAGDENAIAHIQSDDRQDTYRFRPHKLDLLVAPAPAEFDTQDALLAALQDAVETGMVTSPIWQRGFVLTAMEAGRA